MGEKKHILVQVGRACDHCMQYFKIVSLIVNIPAFWMCNEYISH